MKAGALPVMMGTFELKASEMMFIQYMPIKMAGSMEVLLPPNLECFGALVDAVKARPEEYMYITAKHLYVTPDNPGNRPGWHIDGFGTQDLNYIWADSSPTEFCDQEFNISTDEHQSMIDMEAQALEENVVTYPAKSFLLLDNMVVHRVAKNIQAGFRTFVKISVSKHKYNLEGNAHNYLFDYDWGMVKREAARNVTSK